MTKPCRHCYTEIHKRARICPECRRPQTLLGMAKGFLVTLFPMLAAIVSFVVAAAERIEKMDVSSQLAVVSTDLKAEEAKSEAATQVAEQLAAEVSEETLEQNIRDAIGEEPTSESLDEIEKLQSEKKRHSMSREELIKHHQLDIYQRIRTGSAKLRSNGAKKRPDTDRVSLRPGSRIMR